MDYFLKDIDYETQRHAALAEYNILDTLTEKDYEDITFMASLICNAPIALISFIDENRQWFKSHKGISISETLKEHSFCAHAEKIPQQPFVIPDSRKDDRFKDNPYVVGEPNIVFYAGVSFVNENGLCLGTVCVIDTKPRELTNDQLTGLKMLSNQVMQLLETRKTSAHLKARQLQTHVKNSELENTAKRLELALKAGKLGSYELDFLSGYMKTSYQCRRNYGFNETENFNFRELLACILPEDLPQMLEMVNQSVRTNLPFDTEYRIKLPNGEIRWMHASGQPIYNGEGASLQVAGVTADITKQKIFESELERQVQERTNELKDKNIDLERMNQELQSFAYISSHDLQEPLRKIQTFSKRIAEKELDGLTEKAKDYFGRIHYAANRMQILINDLLAYSSTSTIERVFEHTELSTIVNEVKDDLKEEMEAKGATIKFAGGCKVNIILFQFRQLLQNLFTNAIKFSKPNEPLVVEITSNNIYGRDIPNKKLQADVEYCCISVVDNGIGFEQIYAEKIFELFQRLHRTPDYKGTGIGLAIVKKIVENHNGVITAESELGKGATFHIYLPL